MSKNGRKRLKVAESASVSLTHADEADEQGKVFIGGEGTVGLATGSAASQRSLGAPTQIVAVDSGASAVPAQLQNTAVSAAPLRTEVPLRSPLNLVRAPAAGKPPLPAALGASATALSIQPSLSKAIPAPQTSTLKRPRHVWVRSNSTGLNLPDVQLQPSAQNISAGTASDPTQRPANQRLRPSAPVSVVISAPKPAASSALDRSMAMLAPSPADIQRRLQRQGRLAPGLPGPTGSSTSRTWTAAAAASAGDAGAGPRVSTIAAGRGLAAQLQGLQGPPLPQPAAQPCALGTYQGTVLGKGTAQRSVWVRADAGGLAADGSRGNAAPHRLPSSATPPGGASPIKSFTPAATGRGCGTGEANSVAPALSLRRMPVATRMPPQPGVSAPALTMAEPSGSTPSAGSGAAAAPKAATARSAAPAAAKPVAPKPGGPPVQPQPSTVAPNEDIAAAARAPAAVTAAAVTASKLTAAAARAPPVAPASRPAATMQPNKQQLGTGNTGGQPAGTIASGGADVHSTRGPSSQRQGTPQGGPQAGNSKPGGAADAGAVRPSSSTGTPTSSSCGATIKAAAAVVTAAQPLVAAMVASTGDLATVPAAARQPSALGGSVAAAVIGGASGVAGVAATLEKVGAAVAATETVLRACGPDKLWLAVPAAGPGVAAVAAAAAAAPAAAATASRPFGQYLRPGRNKLVRKVAAGGGSAEQASSVGHNVAASAGATGSGVGGEGAAAGGTGGGASAATGATAMATAAAEASKQVSMPVPATTVAAGGSTQGQAVSLAGARPPRPPALVVPSREGEAAAVRLRRLTPTHLAAQRVAQRPAAPSLAVAPGGVRKHMRMTWRRAPATAVAAATTTKAAGAMANASASGSTSLVRSGLTSQTTSSGTGGPGSGAAAAGVDSSQAVAGPQGLVALRRVGLSRLRPAAGLSTAAASRAPRHPGSGAAEAAAAWAAALAAASRRKVADVAAAAAGGARRRTAVRSLRLVTVNGQSYYAARGGAGEGVRQLHSLTSIAGKAAAAAAAGEMAARARPTAAARAVLRRASLAVSPSAAVTRQAAVASWAVRRAVWRRRGLDPTSPRSTASATAVLVAVKALAGRRTSGEATAVMAAGPTKSATKASGRAVAAQRILAKARMRRAAAKATQARGLCPDYCRTGICAVARDPSRGRCPHVHDPAKVAVCGRWLAGSCKEGAACPLQHRRVADLMPLCSYFLQGKCTAADCPYLHKTHPATAPVCRAFLQSHCPRGAACPALHLTAKMARERARLLGTAGRARSAGAGTSPSRAKRRPSDSGACSGSDRTAGGDGGGRGAGGDAGSCSDLKRMGTSWAAALQAPKRRRGGFRYFDSLPEELEELTPAPLNAAGDGGSVAAAPRFGSDGPVDGQGPSEPGGAAMAATTEWPPGLYDFEDGGGGGDGDPDGAVGTEGKCGSGGGRGGEPLLLRGGMKLYL